LAAAFAQAGLKVCGVPLVYRYPIQIFLTAIAFFFVPRLPLMRGEGRRLGLFWIALPLIVGGSAGAVWEMAESHIVYPHLGPSAHLLSDLLAGSRAGWHGPLFAIRCFGFVVLTPVVEELSFRHWLPRLLQNEISGEPNPRALAYFVSAVAFAAVHPEWLPAFFYALLMTGLLKWGRGLWVPIMAHGASNLVLAVFGAW
jgi:membrane protease YdiL (CAAX protease family)